jgi:uroporphyrinogen-III decarboxylase
VWLMRQAGRYMEDFRAFSDKYPFRQRSETPEIAIELSLQPWKAFRTDGVIFFSDILTPLPALGVEFDVIKGTGPVISGMDSSICSNSKGCRSQSLECSSCLNGEKVCCMATQAATLRSHMQTL